MLEICVRLEVGIGLAQRKQPAQRAGELVLSRGDLPRRPRGHGGAAGLDHGVERPAFVRGITFHGFDQIGNQVVSLLQLYIDVGEGLIDALSERDQSIVDEDSENDQKTDDTEKNPT